jgi:hypothetical protein
MFDCSMIYFYKDHPPTPSVHSKKNGTFDKLIGREEGSYTLAYSMYDKDLLVTFYVCCIYCKGHIGWPPSVVN